MAFIYSLADTWNDGATTFKGIALNVTDTASAAGSLLMDLQVGGVSRMTVGKAGALTVGVNSNSARSLIFTTANLGNEGFSATANEIGLWANGSGAFAWKAGSYMLGSGLELSWSNAASPIGNAADLRLFRDAANTLAQRNGVNAQAFNLYNTYTDASNYERGFMRWVGNTLRIGTDALGTGSARSVEFQPGGTTQFAVGIFGPFLPATGLLQWSGRSGLTSPADGVISMRNAADNGGSALQFREQTAPAAPATDNVRIYAEDNGAGKTRLMALFPTGVAQQIAIEP